MVRSHAQLGEDVGQAVELGRVGDGGQQDQVITSGILVPTDEILDGPPAAKVAGSDLGGERAGEGVVVAQVGVATTSGIQTEADSPYPAIAIPVITPVGASTRMRTSPSRSHHAVNHQSPM